MRLVPHARRHVGALVAASVLALGGTATLVAVSAAPASATTVTTESEFRTAWDTDTNITLGADITLTCDGGRADRTGDADFTLDGQGHTITQTCPGNGVLKVDGESSANGVVRNVTITGGTETGTFQHGGGLFFDEDGTLTIDHVAILNNTTCADGGGLDKEGGELTITHSTLAGNHAHGYGGALWAGGVTNVVTDSTISGNQAGANAGAFESEGSDLTLAYVTMVQNGIAPLSGCDEAPTATSSHGSSDSAATFEQIDNGGRGTLTSFGSVVALPPSAGEFNCFLGTSPSASQGYNFSDDHSCGFTATGDRQDAGDPGLGALGANGGLAPTQVPQTGSPLLDAIPVAACQTGAASGVTDDERDITRPQGTGCDVGAVEVVVPVPVIPQAVVVAPMFTG
jgi:hypothetical protein